MAAVHGQKLSGISKGRALWKAINIFQETCGRSGNLGSQSSHQKLWLGEIRFCGMH